MPKRNFRKIGEKTLSTVSTVPGISELYDTYSSIDYPSNLAVTDWVFTQSGQSILGPSGVYYVYPGTDLDFSITIIGWNSGLTIRIAIDPLFSSNPAYPDTFYNLTNPYTFTSNEPSGIATILTGSMGYIGSGIRYKDIANNRFALNLYVYSSTGVLAFDHNSIPLATSKDIIVSSFKSMARLASKVGLPTGTSTHSLYTNYDAGSAPETSSSTIYPYNISYGNGYLYVQTRYLPDVSTVNNRIYYAWTGEEDGNPSNHNLSPIHNTNNNELIQFSPDQDSTIAPSRLLACGNPKTGDMVAVYNDRNDGDRLRACIIDFNYYTDTSDSFENEVNYYGKINLSNSQEIAITKLIPSKVSDNYFVIGKNPGSGLIDLIMFSIGPKSSFSTFDDIWKTGNLSSFSQGYGSSSTQNSIVDFGRVFCYISDFDMIANGINIEGSSTGSYYTYLGLALPDKISWQNSTNLSSPNTIEYNHAKALYSEHFQRLIFSFSEYLHIFEFSEGYLYQSYTLNIPGTNTTFTIDESNNHSIILMYNNSTNVVARTMAYAPPSGTTFGTEVTVCSPITSTNNANHYFDIAYNSTEQRFCIIYLQVDGSNVYPYMVVGTSSGTTITLGTPTLLASINVPYSNTENGITTVKVEYHKSLNRIIYSFIGEITAAGNQLYIGACEINPSTNSIQNSSYTSVVSTKTYNWGYDWSICEFTKQIFLAYTSQDFGLFTTSIRFNNIATNNDLVFVTPERYTLKDSYYYQEQYTTYGYWSNVKTTYDSGRRKIIVSAIYDNFDSRYSPSHKWEMYTIAFDPIKELTYRDTDSLGPSYPDAQSMAMDDDGYLLVLYQTYSLPAYSTNVNLYIDTGGTTLSATTTHTFANSGNTNMLGTDMDYDSLSDNFPYNLDNALPSNTGTGILAINKSNNQITEYLNPTYTSYSGGGHAYTMYCRGTDKILSIYPYATITSFSTGVNNSTNTYNDTWSQSTSYPNYGWDHILHYGIAEDTDNDVFVIASTETDRYNFPTYSGVSISLSLATLDPSTDTFSPLGRTTNILGSDYSFIGTLIYDKANKRTVIFYVKDSKLYSSVIRIIEGDKIVLGTEYLHYNGNPSEVVAVYDELHEKIIVYYTISDSTTTCIDLVEIQNINTSNEQAVILDTITTTNATHVAYINLGMGSDDSNGSIDTYNLDKFWIVYGRVNSPSLFAKTGTIDNVNGTISLSSEATLYTSPTNANFNFADVSFSSIQSGTISNTDSLTACYDTANRNVFFAWHADTSDNSVSGDYYQRFGSFRLDTTNGTSSLQTSFHSLTGVDISNCTFSSAQYDPSTCRILNVWRCDDTSPNYSSWYHTFYWNGSSYVVDTPVRFNAAAFYHVKRGMIYSRKYKRLIFPEYDTSGTKCNLWSLELRHGWTNYIYFTSHQKDPQYPNEYFVTNNILYSNVTGGDTPRIVSLDASLHPTLKIPLVVLVKSTGMMEVYTFNEDLTYTRKAVSEIQTHYEPDGWPVNSVGGGKAKISIVGVPYTDKALLFHRDPTNTDFYTHRLIYCGGNTRNEDVSSYANLKSYFEVTTGGNTEAYIAEPAFGGNTMDIIDDFTRTEDERFEIMSHRTALSDAAMVNYSPIGFGTLLLDNFFQYTKVTVTPSATTVNEGSSVTFTIVINANVIPSTLTLDWEINPAGLTTEFKTTDWASTTGTVNIIAGTGTLTLTPLADNLIDDYGNEQFTVDFIYDGTVLATSEIITINDTSNSGGSEAPQGTDITSSFYEISNRFLASPTSSDYTGAYDVGEIDTDFSGSGNIFIGIKVTASTTFYNDISVAAVQHVDSTRTVLKNSWVFNTSSGGTGSGWTTHFNQIAGSFSVGFPISPASAKFYSAGSISTTPNIGRFSWATGTGSSFTGTADGISSFYNTNILPAAGNGVVSQSSSTYYAYRETSGSTRYSGTFMKSPSVTFTPGDIIIVCHLLVGNSGSQMNPNDSLYVGVA
jgi:hypothetical protein